MKKIISLLIISIFTLSSCSNPKELENNIFNKKVQCWEINFHEDIKSNWWTFAEKYSIDEVFYSNSKNTCIWIVTLYLDQVQDIWLYDILEKKWIISKWYNSLWNCNYWEENLPLNEICILQEQKFNTELEKLKQ